MTTSTARFCVFVATAGKTCRQQVSALIAALSPIIVYCCALLMCVHQSSAQATDSLLEARFDSLDSKYDKLFSFSKNGHECWTQILSKSALVGRMPTFTEFCKVVSSFDNKLQKDDYSMLWLAFAKSQRPSIDQFELATLLNSQKSMLESSQIKYTVEQTLDGKQSHTSVSEFAFDGSKLFYDTETITYAPRTRRRQVLSYDLRDMVVVKAHGEEIDRWGTGGAALASRGPLDHIERFIGAGNPFLLQALLPTSRFPIQSDIRLDKEASECCLCESRESFAGESCIVLANYYTRYYISPELGYALVGYTKGETAFDSTGRLVERTPWFTQNAEEFREEKVGVFFPRHIEQSVVTPDYSRSLEVDVLSLSLNHAIDDAFFTEVIPNQALVADLRKKEAATRHWKGPETSSVSTPKDGNGFLMSLLLALNIGGLILILAALILRKRQRNA